MQLMQAYIVHTIHMQNEEIKRKEN